MKWVHIQIQPLHRQMTRVCGIISCHLLPENTQNTTFFFADLRKFKIEITHTFRYYARNFRVKGISVFLQHSLTDEQGPVPGIV